MIKYRKEDFSRASLLKGRFGIEREGLRCDEKGHLVHTPHPSIFGDKLKNPFITTDFSESQVEVITPAFQSLDASYDFLEALYDMVALEIGDEYLWPQSMPNIVPEDDEIPIATYGDSEKGAVAHNYRKKLIKKYGGKKQLISGIHYNFSFDEKLIERLYEIEGKGESYKEYRNNIYLKVTRNYLRYRWLIIYLFGSTSLVHESYANICKKSLDLVGDDGYGGAHTISYRNSRCGYTNQVDLFPDYSSIETYKASLEQYAAEGIIESHKELYSQVRLKVYDNDRFLDSLATEGIAYLEYRSIDINPFDKAGMAKEDMLFMHLFNLFLLFKEETSYPEWQKEALDNQYTVAISGLDHCQLKRDGEMASKEAWGTLILKEMREINDLYNLNQANIIDGAEEKLKDPSKTYAYRLKEKVREEGYIGAHMALAKSYKADAIRNRYKFKGYEDLELSTQILMREAIKRGIKADLIDRMENFIVLKRDEHTAYIKQATKTSLDNYVTVLMMENKTVTKEVLKRAGLVVPEGISIDSLDENREEIEAFVNQPVVVKPKSTNFGLGISIFPEGTVKEDLIRAVEIAFTHDQTVLIESFVKGKEYRFLVMGDEVVGILHRVPANVMGDGKKTIRELVTIKNKDPLRGKGYKTPLEKIELDESAALFLKQSGMSFNTVPSIGEIVYLRENSNISTGGDSIDYTDLIPDRFKKIAVASAKAVDAVICGVDMMIEDDTDETSPYGIIELNFNPAIHIHCYPYKGTERPIAGYLLDLLGYK